MVAARACMAMSLRSVRQLAKQCAVIQLGAYVVALLCGAFTRVCFFLRAAACSSFSQRQREGLLEGIRGGTAGGGEWQSVKEPTWHGCHPFLALPAHHHVTVLMF